jgi:hypothetical protein
MRNMLTYFKICFDSPRLCLVTRPLAGLVFAGAIAGAFGLMCGLAYGAFHNSLDFAILGGLRLGGAGAVAGFVVGLLSGVDRIHWPVDAWGELEKPGRLLPLKKVRLRTELTEVPAGTRTDGTDTLGLPSGGIGKQLVSSTLSVS